MRTFDENVKYKLVVPDEKEKIQKICYSLFPRFDNFKEFRYVSESKYEFFKLKYRENPNFLRE